MTHQDKSLHPAKYYRDYISLGVRPDGRELKDFRPVIVNLGYISTADGSALAKVGNTIVVCGIKAELCQPKAETSDQGFLIPNVELSPLCSSKFRPGPPSEQAQVYTKLIADIIENSGCISLKELCIHTDKLAWCLFADLICLNFDGGVIDACVVALMAALQTLTLPAVDYDPALDNKLVNLEERRPVNIKNVPVSTTFAIFEDKVIISDPTVEEEDLCSGIVTVVTTNGNLCSVHKPGGSPLTDEQLFSLIETSKKREVHIYSLINKALESGS